MRIYSCIAHSAAKTTYRDLMNVNFGNRKNPIQLTNTVLGKLAETIGAGSVSKRLTKVSVRSLS